MFTFTPRKQIAEKMDHVVYLDYKAKEFINLKNGDKTMLIRGAMGRKIPYGRVEKDDVLFFIENNAEGLVKAMASVQEVFTSDKLTREESIKWVEDNQEKLVLNSGLKKRFSGKRYLILISVKNFEEIEPFEIDTTNYGNMDDWLLVENIDSVKT